MSNDIHVTQCFPNFQFVMNNNEMLNRQFLHLIAVSSLGVFRVKLLLSVHIKTSTWKRQMNFSDTPLAYNYENHHFWLVVDPLIQNFKTYILRISFSYIKSVVSSIFFYWKRNVFAIYFERDKSGKNEYR